MEYVRQTITKHSLALGIPVVIDGSRIFEADFTTANVRTTHTFHAYLESLNIFSLYRNVKDEYLKTIITSSLEVKKKN